MPRLPWFAFYPADWFRDTKCLSLQAKGAWIDLLGILWDSKTRGKKTLDLDGWALELGKPVSEVETVFRELQKREIADYVTESNGDITIMSRRQLREEKERESTRCRVRKYRSGNCNGASNGSVTQEKAEGIYQNQKAEGRKKKEEKKSVARSRRLTDEEFLLSLKNNQAYSHIDFEVELGKMDAWLLTHSGREKTRKFIVNWLNKIEKPMAIKDRPRSLVDLL